MGSNPTQPNLLLLSTHGFHYPPNAPSISWSSSRVTAVSCGLALTRSACFISLLLIQKGVLINGHPNLEQDLAVTRAVRKRLPDAIELPVDYNQALTVAEAIRRGRALEGEGVAWLEEPVRHDDYAGNATVARALAVPVQIGENFNGPEAMIEALAARACDYVMPDAARIGGVSGWIQAAGIAAAHGIEMSSHLLPEISAHLLAASPTCHYLEYVDWADAILEEPLQIQEGLARVPDRPGIGLTWRSEAVKALSLDR